MGMREALIATGGLTIGALGAWLIVKDYYKKQTKEEIQAVREYYKGVVAANESYERDLREYEAQVRDLDYAKAEETREPEEDLEELRVIGEVTEIEEDEGGITVNGRLYDADEPGEEDARTKRDTSRPYIISAEEYDENHYGHHQTELTYWEEDGVLTEPNEMIVTDTDGTVGDDNLNSFGDDPSDPDVIYVRNEKRDIDFEITRDRRSYEETVVGFKHSEDYGPKIRRMRFDD